MIWLIVTLLLRLSPLGVVPQKTGASPPPAPISSSQAVSDAGTTIDPDG